MKKVFAAIKNDRQLLLQILFVFAAFFIMALLGSIFGGLIIDRNVESYGKEVVSTTSERIIAYFDEYKVIIDDIAFSLVLLNEEGYTAADLQERVEAWTVRLRESNKKYEHFSGFYGVVNGVFIDGSGWDPMNPDSEDYDPDYWPLNRPWHLGALGAKGEVHFTDPYIDADTGEYVLTASKMLAGSDGRAFGVIAMDFFLGDVETIVNSVKLMDSGYGVLLDSERRIIVTANHGRVGAYFDSVDEAHAQIGKSLDAADGETVHHRVRSAGEDFVVFFRQLPDSGWYVGVASLRANYYSDITRIGAILFGAGVLMAIPLCFVLVLLHMRKKRADEANNLKSSFLAKMSHEMRTPMNAIVGMSELLSHEELSGKQMDYVKEIDGQAHLLLRLINGFLDVSELEKGADKGGATAFTAPNARVLVVDDTEVNLKVVAGLLKNLYKIEAVTAPSGFEAVRLVRENDFDVIFMDHMMPEMDGIETVNVIRKLGGKHKTQKFVALTANAIAGVEEMFMDNGFTAFLLKPIDTAKLGAVLLEVLPDEKIVRVTDAENTIDNVGTTAPGRPHENVFMNALAEIDAINAELALSRVSGLEDMLHDTLELFFDKLPSERAYLDTSLNSGDLKGFAIKVHGIKSSLAAVGAMGLSETAFELEKASKAGDSGFCKERLPGFLSQLDELYGQLQGIFGEIDAQRADTRSAPTEDSEGKRSDSCRGEPCVRPQGEQVENNEDFTRNLNDAIEACEDFDDTRALELVETMLKAGGNTQTMAQLKSARAAIKDFDYDTAVEVLKKLSADIQSTS